MKKIIAVICTFLFLIACKKTDNRESIFLPVDKLYMIEIGCLPDFEDKTDSLFMRINGFVEIDKDFNIKMTKRMNCKAPYRSGNISITDTLKKEIIKMVNIYSSDTVFRDDKLRIYDDYSYVYIVKKFDGQTFSVGFGACAHGNLRDIKDQLFCDSVFEKLEYIEPNQDSVMQRILNFDKYVFLEYPMPPTVEQGAGTKYFVPKYYRW